MGSKAIVTLADSNYFELLLELIDSIKNWKESETYLLGSQKKSIFWENRMSEYKYGDELKKQKLRKINWGV